MGDAAPPARGRCRWICRRPKGEGMEQIFCGRSGSPVLLVSACLCGVACRYDGRSAAVPALAALEAAGLALAMCPEVDGGLSVPRAPCELLNGRALTKDGRDCSRAYLAGARMARDLARRHGIRLAVLKERSPSCGVSRVYDGSFCGRLIPGMGLAAALLAAEGMTVVNEENFAEAVKAVLPKETASWKPTG